MIDTTDISKMVKHIVRRGQGVSDPHIMHPMRDWILGIGVVFLFVGGGAVLSFHLYRTYDAQRTAEITAVAPIVSYAAATVAEAVRVYSMKRDAYEAVLGTPDLVPNVQTASSTPEVVESLATSSESMTVEAPATVVPELPATDDVPATVSPAL